MTFYEKAEQKWNQLRREFPLLAEELDQLTLSDEEWQLLKIVYAGLDAHDVPSVEPQMMLEYVRSSLLVRREISYACGVPEELFLDYVLPPRVNNEYLDGSREWLYEQIRPRIQGKSMLDAALEVNYWCYERATYQSTDDRTIAPMGMCRRAKGRCGEESTLLTSALRAVGIPARQVYVPYWAHCDDNHAWVEFWAEGQWHYMGACEPEPVPDVGWFQSAASRAMLVRSRVPDFEAECGYRVVNSTAIYADVTVLKVKVVKDGTPVPDARVNFQLINESRIVTIHFEMTDEQGSAAFSTGLGCLIVSAYLDGHWIEKTVDLRSESETTLHWEDGFDPLREERSQIWELIPPAEKLPRYNAQNAAHTARLRKCEEIRSVYENSFKTDSQWHTYAKGNFREIESFLNLPGYCTEDKEMLLSTLTEKDFADVTCETLADYLTIALRYKDRYSIKLWKNQILAPRVEHEMLLSVRGDIQKRFEGCEFRSEGEVLEWMGRNLRRLPEYGLTDRRGNAAGYLRHGVCPESEWGILAVQICRALGIPALLHDRMQDTVRLSLHSGEPLRQRDNFTLSRWEAGEYRFVQYPEDGSLLPGSYSLITSRRQIDGIVSARIERFVLLEDREIKVQFCDDQTASKLKAVPLSICSAKPGLLIFLNPGAEPTEHLLLELLELKDEINQGCWSVRFMIPNEASAENETFRRVLQSTIGCTIGYFEPFEHYRIQSAMGLGDSRLPLAVVLDGDGNGVYGCANYNIRSVHTMVRILKMIT